MGSFLSSETHASDDVDGIIAQAKSEWAANRQSTSLYRTRGFAYPKDSPTVWVKWGHDPHQVRSEAVTQNYIHENLDRLDESIRKGVQVPEVFRFIPTELEDELPAGLIVMEYVPGPSVKSLLREHRGSDKAALYKERVLDALSALLSFQPEEGTAPGPEGGGRIEHFVFGMDDSTAPKDFETLEELQSWVNKEVQNSQLGSGLEPANFTAEGLHLCYCDLNLSNFIIPDPSDASSPIYVIDFEHTSWLPFSFLVWEMRFKRYGLKEVELSERSNLAISQKNVDVLSMLGVIMDRR